MGLGAILDLGHRTRLNQLAMDLVFNSLLCGRLEHMHTGGFPSRERVEADVFVKWGPNRVPFSDVRRVYEPDIRSIQGWGVGRLGSILDERVEVEAIPRKVGWPAEIDAELARRMPEPSLPVASGADLPPMGISWPLVTLTLEGPLFRRLCEGVDVPWSPLRRRDLDTEVRLFGPDGVTRWNDASLISEAEMKALGIEFANRAYTLLLGVAEGRIGVAPPAPGQWGHEEFEPGLLPS
jgi:hypothetical protein